jgi:hypothetical protein
MTGPLDLATERQLPPERLTVGLANAAGNTRGFPLPTDRDVQAPD